MPVHPCGGYNMQSVMSILEKHYRHKTLEEGNNLKKLYTIHRLDRLTSGLVVLGKTSSIAQSYSKSIMNRSCTKIYLARVAGKFPLKYKALKNFFPELVLASGIPLHGEWKEDFFVDEGRSVESYHQSSAISKEALNSNVASRLRKRNALACWIEDGDGKAVFEDDERNTRSILEQVFQQRHSVNDWLESIDPSIDGNGGTDKLWFHLACPTRIAKHKDGICEAGSFHDLNDELYIKSVKPAHTSFGVVSYDQKTDSTLLICRPYTGRTHQIRLHLQHLEHPIANDPNYGGDIWYGNPDGRRASKIAINRLDTIKNSNDNLLGAETKIHLGHKDEKLKKTDHENIQCKKALPTIDIPATEREVREGISTAVQGKEESIHDFIERTCVWCARCRSMPSTDRDILEFIIRSPGIWLHALQYSFLLSSALDNGSMHGEKELVQSFRTSLPEWHDMQGEIEIDAFQVVD